jgi:chromosomal replication initiation ATPase DnaA
VAKALSGLCRRNWRRLRLPVLPGTVSEALHAVLQLLGSPLAMLVRRAVRLPAAESAVATDSSQLLRTVGHAITPEIAAATYAESVRQGLARQLAVVPTRPVMPRSVVLWGRPGSGIDHLMVAAVHPLFEAEIVSQVFRVSAARLAAGRVFAQEVDAALMTLFDDVAECDGCLLLVQDLQACVTNSVVSHQLLCRALDAGLRMFASVSSDTVLARLRDDEATARRLAAVQVPPPDPAQTVAVLERLAAASQLKVDRPAIETAVRIADRQQAAQPAAAVALLGAAMAEAAWAGRAQLGPEDIVAVLQSQWPDDP